MAKGLSDLHVSYLGHPSTPAPLGVSSFHQGGEGKVLEHVPSSSLLCSCRVSLAPSWHLEKFGKLKKKFFLKSLSIAPQPCQGAMAKRKEGRRGVGE